MDILILTGYSGFTQRTHSILRLLKKDLKINSINCLVMGGHNYRYLKSQKDFEYNNLIYIDNLLRDLEKNSSKKLLSEYENEINKVESFLNISINKILFSERVLIQHTHNLIYKKKLSQNQIICIFFGLYYELEKLVKNNSVVVTYTSASLTSEILYYLCKAYKKQYLTLNETRVSNKWSVIDNNIDYHREIDEIYKKLSEPSEDGKNLYFKYLNNLNENKKNIIEQNYQIELLNSKKINFKNIYRFIRNLILIKNKDTHFLSPDKKTKIIRNLVYYKNIFLTKNIAENKIPKEKYLYLPLSVIPEASTLIRGQIYYDQLSLIKRISLELPSNYVLLVRDHPAMLGLNTYSFYKEIKKMYNVRLINPKYNNNEIIMKAEAVITVTGTSGLESLFLGKKTIALGKSIYSTLKSVYYLDNLSNLKNILLKKHDEKIKKDQEADLQKFTTAICMSKCVDDKDLVLWTKKSFVNNTIDIDIGFKQVLKNLIIDDKTTY